MTGRRPAAPPVRLLLADDHEMVLTCLASALQAVEDFHVVAALTRSEEVLAAAVRTRPTVALLDHMMPGRNGLQLSADIAEVLPSCRTALMTATPQRDVVRAAITQGVLSVVSKATPLSQLIDTLRSVAAGRLTIESELLTGTPNGRPSGLSQRETEVLRAISTGAPLGEIAEQLSLSLGTVRNLSSKLIKKLNARNRFDAARVARDAGWI
ncbi:response regulator transcription factor [Streptomyces tibetensis]|uniref:response regulator transcription factor n=1 Tax=Streptomyces tibetensis TaxID=2382123 RepID=UPI0033DEFC29